jgi:hypothetical protein
MGGSITMAMTEMSFEVFDALKSAGVPKTRPGKPPRP